MSFCRPLGFSGLDLSSNFLCFLFPSLSHPEVQEKQIHSRSLYGSNEEGGKNRVGGTSIQGEDGWIYHLFSFWPLLCSQFDSLPQKKGSHPPMISSGYRQKMLGICWAVTGERTSQHFEPSTWYLRSVTNHGHVTQPNQWTWHEARWCSLLLEASPPR